MSAAEHESVLFGQPMEAAEGLTAGQRWTAAVALGLAAVLLSVNGHRHIELGSLTSGGPALAAVPSTAVGPVPLPDSAPMPAMPTFATASPAPTTGDTGGITFTPTSDSGSGSSSDSGSSDSADSGSGKGGSGDKASCGPANSVLAPTGQTAPAQLDPACAAAGGG